MKYTFTIWNNVWKSFFLNRFLIMHLVCNVTNTINAYQIYMNFVYFRSVRISATDQFYLMATRCCGGQRPVLFFITLLFCELNVSTMDLWFTVCECLLPWEKFCSYDTILHCKLIFFLICFLFVFTNKVRGSRCVFVQIFFIYSFYICIIL